MSNQNTFVLTTLLLRTLSPYTIPNAHKSFWTHWFFVRPISCFSVIYKIKCKVRLICHARPRLLSSCYVCCVLDAMHRRMLHAACMICRSRMRMRWTIIYSNLSIMIMCRTPSRTLNMNPATKAAIVSYIVYRGGRWIRVKSSQIGAQAQRYPSYSIDLNFNEQKNGISITNHDKHSSIYIRKCVLCAWPVGDDIISSMYKHVRIQSGLSVINNLSSIVACCNEIEGANSCHMLRNFECKYNQ